MKRKIGYGLLALIGLLILAVLVGQGPAPVAIPETAALATEYPFPDEAATAEATAELVLTSIKERYPDGQKMLRDAHPYSHGCVRGTFRVSDSVPAALKHGVFATPASYPVWIRFSNGGTQPKPDKEGDIRGMAVKLMGVDGPKLAADESRTQDFLLINNPVLPVGDPAEYLALFRAGLAQKPMSYFFGGLPHNWKLAAFRKVIAIRRKEIPSMLAIRYWSTTPYLLGTQAVKYSARPCAPVAGERPKDPAEKYLRQDLVERLSKDTACFEFMVQPQTDARTMPVEDPAVEWDENASPFVPLAKIEIPVQSFDTPAQNEFCENLSMNPWHARPEHRPLGGINRVRKLAYERIAKFRMDKNGVPHREPNGSESF